MFFNMSCAKGLGMRPISIITIIVSRDEFPYLINLGCNTGQIFLNKNLIRMSRLGVLSMILLLTVFSALIEPGHGGSGNQFVSSAITNLTE